MFLSELVQSAAHNYIFKPPQPRPPLQDFVPLSKTHMHVRLRTVGGDDVHCKLVTPFDKPCNLIQYTPSGNILIFLHGNADDLSTCHAYTQWLADMTQSNVLAVDYPGYGLSSGHGNTTEETMNWSAEAVFDFAVNKLQHSVESVIIVGKSLGTVPAIYMSAQQYCADLAGVLLISPLASGARCVLPTFAKNMGSNLMPFLDNVFANSLHRIKSTECPVMIIHGINDSVVPVNNAHTLAAAIKARAYYPPLFVEAGHNDIEAKFQSLMITSCQDFVSFCNDRVHSRTKAQCLYDD